MTHSARLAVPFAIAATLLVQPTAAQEPPDGEGPIGTIRQPIVAGNALTPDEQRALGLVTVAGGCSGTLLNRFWVLTARHCVSNEPPNASAAVDIGAPVWPEGTLTVTAAWDPGHAVPITAYREVSVNAPPATPARDIVMAYLGRGDFGEVGRRIPFITQRGPTTVRRWVGQRVTDQDRILLYGQGFGTLATGVFGTASATPATGLGIYRSAVMQASNISDTGFDMVANPGQVGHGGDSGGPAVVYENGFYVGIAGVQSTCTPAGYIASASAANPTPATWMWASGISACQYVATQPFVREIGRAMQVSPLCKGTAECAAWAGPALAYVLAPEADCGSAAACAAPHAAARMVYSLN